MAWEPKIVVDNTVATEQLKLAAERIQQATEATDPEEQRKLISQARYGLENTMPEYEFLTQDYDEIVDVLTATAATLDNDQDVDYFLDPGNRWGSPYITHYDEAPQAAEEYLAHLREICPVMTDEQAEKLMERIQETQRRNIVKPPEGGYDFD